MAELLTPHRDILQSLTNEVASTGLDPFEAYEKLVSVMNANHLWFDTYGSSSITSGGHARDNSLEMREVVSKNTRSAFDLCEELFSNAQLDPLETIEAVAVGKITHWSQSDYMEF